MVVVQSGQASATIGEDGQLSLIWKFKRAPQLQTSTSQRSLVVRLCVLKRTLLMLRQVLLRMRQKLQGMPAHLYEFTVVPTRSTYWMSPGMLNLDSLFK